MHLMLWRSNVLTAPAWEEINRIQINFTNVSMKLFASL